MEFHTFTAISDELNALRARVQALEGKEPEGPVHKLGDQYYYTDAEVAEQLRKSSGVDGDAGDWTQTGDGTGYPDATAGPNPSSPVPTQAQADAIQKQAAAERAARIGA